MLDTIRLRLETLLLQSHLYSGPPVFGGIGVCHLNAKYVGISMSPESANNLIYVFIFGDIQQISHQIYIDRFTPILHILWYYFHP